MPDWSSFETEPYEDPLAALGEESRALPRGVALHEQQPKSASTGSRLFGDVERAVTDPVGTAKRGAKAVAGSLGDLGSSVEKFGLKHWKLLSGLAADPALAATLDELARLTPPSARHAVGKEIEEVAGAVVKTPGEGKNVVGEAIHAAGRITPAVADAVFRHFYEMPVPLLGGASPAQAVEELKRGAKELRKVAIANGEAVGLSIVDSALSAMVALGVARQSMSGQLPSTATEDRTTRTAKLFLQQAESVNPLRGLGFADQVIGLTAVLVWAPVLEEEEPILFSSYLETANDYLSTVDYTKLSVELIKLGPHPSCSKSLGLLTDALITLDTDGLIDALPLSEHSKEVVAAVVGSYELITGGPKKPPIPTYIPTLKRPTPAQQAAAIAAANKDEVLTHGAQVQGNVSSAMRTTSSASQPAHTDTPPSVPQTFIPTAPVFSPAQEKKEVALAKTAQKHGQVLTHGRQIQ